MPKHTEDNYVDWVLRGIDRYYTERNFTVFTYSVGQRLEKELPFDRFVYVNNKIVGLQFKAPANNKAPWKYEFDAVQHDKLKKTKWIHYCLPEFDDPQLQNVALNHVHFARPNAVNLEIGRPMRSIGWGEFATGIEECPIGLLLPSTQTVTHVINQMRDDPADAYVVLNRLYRQAHLVRIRKDGNDRSTPESIS